MSQILVTGASGFVGSNLVEELVRRGQRVRCLVRPESQIDLLRKLGVELAVGDYGRPESLAAALAGVDLVYHVAGLTKSLTPAELFRVNRDATENLARACAEQASPPRLVLVSSVAAAGPASRGQIRIESDPAAPVSNYGRSKLAGEQAAARYADRVPTTIVRPGVVFGPRDRGLVSAFRILRLVRFHLSPGLFPPPLSLIYVADLVELLLRAAERGTRLPASKNGSAGQGCYFAAAPEYPSYAQLGVMVRPLLRRPFAPVIPLPGPVAWCVAGASEAVARVRGAAGDVTFDKIQEALASSWACSGEAARTDLGFTPPLPLVERFRETIAWYQSERWL